MKKVVLALCAVMMLGMAACKKDNVEPANPSGGDSHPTQIPTGEGYFNPVQRISSIIVDGEVSEEWDWNNDVVTTIMTPGEGGSMLETSWFEYSNYRLMGANTTLQGMPVLIDYSYSGDKLASVSASSGPMEVLNIVFTHSAEGKISHLTMNINEYVLAILSELFGNSFPNIFGKTLAAVPGKFSVNSTDFAADLTWQGDNVSQFALAGDVSIDATLGEIREMINLDSLLGSYSVFLSALGDSTVIPITISLSETSTFTYDNKSNPFYGFFGRLDPSMLSANNVTTVSNDVSATLSASLNLGFMVLPLSFPLPIPVDVSPVNLTYTYNAAGFPETATAADGSVTRYVYLQ